MFTSLLQFSMTWYLFCLKHDSNFRKIMHMGWIMSNPTPPPIQNNSNNKNQWNSKFVSCELCLSFNSVFAGMIKLQWSCCLCSNEIGTVPLSLKAADSSPGPIGNKQTESLAHLPLFVSVYLSYLSWRHRVKSPPLTFPLEWPSLVPATLHWTEGALTPIRTILSESEAASWSRNHHQRTALPYFKQ